jgi:two-component system cell cycle sensor histidine kinase/response regulator CckA
MEAEEVNILIVEDSLPTTMYLKRILEEREYTVIRTAVSGSEAIQEIQEQPADLILMDIMLDEELDGIETARAIKDSLDVPIIYITASTDEGNLTRARETNPHGYLIKPVNDIELYTVVELALFRHQLEKRLAESEERYRTLLSSISSIIIGIDTSNIITHWNAIAEDIFGRTASETVGRSIYNFEICRDIETIREGIERSRNNNEALYLSDIPFINRNGEEGFLGISINKIKSPEGTITGFLLYGKDVTEKRILEQQLVQSSKMASLGEMATGIAHEINQPLNVIKIAAQLVKESINENDYTPDFILERSGVILSQVEKASAIIDHIRIFGRKDDLNFVDLDPHKPIRDAFHLLGEQLKKHSIEYSLELDTSEVLISGDANRLEQVFINLIINARDALDSCRECNNKMIRVSSFHNADPDTICIHFEDNGPGIPDAIMSRVFEPFFTTKDVGKGTGLGLSISYSIIKSHDGTIVVSPYKGGTRFTITLPVKDVSGIQRKNSEQVREVPL